MKAKLHYVFTLTIFLIVFSAIGQNSWKRIEVTEYSELITKLKLDRNKVTVFEFEKESFNKNVSKANLRTIGSKPSETIIEIPSEEGKTEAFRIYEDPVFSPSLAAKYPNIKSYVGFSIHNPGTKLRMSVSPQGVQTMLTINNKPTLFMQPVSKGAKEYVLYDEFSKSKLTDKFECKTIDDFNKTSPSKTAKTTINEGGANDQTLQKFRIAISVTGEYTEYHDDKNSGNGDAVSDALAAINATLSRVNEVFETDMAVKFELVDATQLIYTNASTDPYSPASIGVDGAWSTELQSTLTTFLGNPNYDIGHLFGATGGGGNAGCIGCVCVNNSKGSGYTSPADDVPEGDSFDLDFVTHEIGHQMGANHTFAFDVEGIDVNSEPGNGTTIMGYAGTGGSDEIQLHSDEYFHYHSIKQILENLTFKSCQTTSAIFNSPPSANAGNDYYIPKGTPYILKGSATDPNGSDNLTYCWEQIDSGLSNYLNFGPELIMGPTNRSMLPSSSPNRYIPRFSSVLSGNITQINPTLGSTWETVSTVGRTLNWALTVRDRSPSNAVGGQSSFDRMQITVEDVTPFTVVNPVTWTQGATVNISWVVGQTKNATINCQNVNIKLSTNGGLTFPTTIASNTPNDGSFSYTVPAISNTNSARILVEAVNNIFYDVSDFNFSISNVPEFFIVKKTLAPITCGATSAVYTFDYVTSNGFSNNTIFSASGLPIGATTVFSPANRTTSGPFTLTINNLTTQGNYNFTVTGTSSIIKNVPVNLPFTNGVCSSIANNEYNTSTTLVKIGSINNVSAKPSGYSNYKNLSTNLNRNSSYDLTVNVNTDGNFQTVSTVWIDWNQNCSFNDPGEVYNLGTAINVSNGATSNSPFSVLVPVNAVLGNTVMRVSTKYDVAAGPCESGYDGEVEDYTINVLPTLSIEEFGFDNLNVFPNPNNGSFTIKLMGAIERSINIEVYDIRGRAIFRKSYDNNGDFNQEIHLSNVQSGMYILNVNDGLRKTTKKLIIK